MRARLGAMEDDDHATEAKPKRAGRRAPAKVSARSLENAALQYLERFSTSSEGLRRVLLRRVQRSAHFHGTDAAEASGWVDAVIEKMQAKGFLNDRLFAEGRTRTLLAQGVPLRCPTCKADDQWSPESRPGSSEIDYYLCLGCQQYRVDEAVVMHRIVADPQVDSVLTAFGAALEDALLAFAGCVLVIS
ncbi:MAG: hypothetical protein VW338_18470, partial [Rhodospirillaceae bacterium]